MHKMLVQVGGILDHAALQRATDGDVVEDRKVLYVFTQSNAPRVRADRNAESGRHQQNRQNFVDSTNATGIDLANRDGVGLKELFEHYTILNMLAGGNAYGCNGARNGRMSKYIIRAGGFFNPERVKGCQAL